MRVDRKPPSYVAAASDVNWAKAVTQRRPKRASRRNASAWTRAGDCCSPFQQGWVSQLDLDNPGRTLRRLHRRTSCQQKSRVEFREHQANQLKASPDLRSCTRRFLASRNNRNQAGRARSLDNPLQLIAKTLCSTRASTMRTHESRGARARVGRLPPGNEREYRRRQWNPNAQHEKWRRRTFASQHPAAASKACLQWRVWLHQRSSIVSSSSYF